MPSKPQQRNPLKTVGHTVIVEPGTKKSPMPKRTLAVVRQTNNDTLNKLLDEDTHDRLAAQASLVELVESVVGKLPKRQRDKIADGVAGTIFGLTARVQRRAQEACQIEAGHIRGGPRHEERDSQIFDAVTALRNEGLTVEEVYAQLEDERIFVSKDGEPLTTGGIHSAYNREKRRRAPK